MTTKNNTIDDIILPQEMLKKFQEELGELQKKYSVAIVPYIKTYNSGKQEATLEFRIIDNGNTQERNSQ